MAAPTRLMSGATGAPPRWRAIVTVLIVVHAALAVSAYLRPAADDVPRYFAIAIAHGHPYVDYPVEYPLLAVLLFRGIGSVARDIDTFGRVLVTLNIAADVLIATVLWREWTSRVCMVYLALMAPLLALDLTKVDLVSGALAVIAVAALRRRRPAAFGVAIAAGVAARVWPGFLGLTVLAADGARKARRPAAWMAGALLAYLALTLLYGGVASLQQVLSFRGASHPQVESTVGAVGRLLTSPTAVLENVAWRVAALPGWLDTAASAASLLAGVGGAALIGRWCGSVGVGWVATISLVLVAAPVLSPQYIVWIVPGAAIAVHESARAVAVMAAVVVTLTWVISATYPSVIAGSVAAELVVVGRDAALLGLAAVALRTAWSRRPRATQRVVSGAATTASGTSRGR